jgi:hypothetical protein
MVEGSKKFEILPSGKAPIKAPAITVCQGNGASDRLGQAQIVPVNPGCSSGGSYQGGQYLGEGLDPGKLSAGVYCYKDIIPGGGRMRSEAPNSKN